MKTLIALAATSTLLAGGTALAQDIPATPPATAPQPIQSEAVPPSDAPAPEMTSADVTDEQVSSFAAAAIRMREVRADETLDDAGKRAAAEAIVAEEGLTPQDYQAIGTAAQADPALAERIQLAFAGMQGESDS